MPTGSVRVTHSVADTLAFLHPHLFKSCGFAAHTKLVSRPITLTGCVYVIFKVCWQEDARRWDETYRGWLDDAMEAAEGCTVLQSALRRRSCAELATLDSLQAAKRVHQALMRNCPNRMLYMTMQAYLSVRILLAVVMVVDSIQSTNGIFAECAPGN